MLRPLPDRPSHAEPPTTIHQLIERQAGVRPTAEAMAAPDGPALSYLDLWHYVSNSVGRLRQAGFGPGDRVAVAVPNGLRLAAVVLGVAAGVTAVPVNLELTESELGVLFAATRVRAVAVQAGGCDAARAAVALAHRLDLAVVELAAPQPGIGQHAPEYLNRPGPGRLPRPDDIAVILMTSGTTSQPKAVPLRQDDTCAQACRWGAAYQLGPGDRCLSTSPYYHLAGLVAGLLAVLATGGSILCTTGFVAGEYFRWMDAYRPTWCTALPALHQALWAGAAEHREVVARCPLRFLRTGSAPTPPEVQARLEQAFGVPVVGNYAMTEVSPITVCPLEPGRNRPGSAGLPFGTEIRIADETGGPVAPGAPGEILVRGGNLMRGYDNDPEADRHAFRGDWFGTGDLGYVDADGYLFVTGRLKEIINRGGQKVVPLEVDQTLERHPAVARAVAFAVPDPRLGEDVVAAVVLRPGQAVTAQELRAFAARTLAPFKVPRRVVLVSEIPRTALGKVRRSELAAQLGLTGSTRSVPGGERFCSPRTPTERVLTEIWAEVLGLERVGVRDDFLELGGDSLMAVTVFAAIEARLGRRLSLAALLQHGTIEELAAHLDRAPRQPGRTLVHLAGTGPLPALFCVHPLGGDVLCYQRLARLIQPDQPVYGLRARGLDGREGPLHRIEEMAALYVEELRACQPAGPYFMAGHSMGGLIAYEMARLLHGGGERVALLALFDTGRPARRPSGVWPRARRLGHRLVEKVRFHRHRLGGLPLTARLAYAWDNLSERWRRARLPEPVRRVTAANYRAAANYVPRPYSGAVTLFRAANPMLVHRTADPMLGWGELVTGGLEVHEVPGTHAELLRPPEVDTLVARLRECLARARASG